MSRRYCPEILQQVDAASAALRSFKSSLLRRHLYCCVKEVLESKQEIEIDNKIEELLDLIKKG